MIEIQIHPSDIRRKVRYFFLNRRAVLVGIGVLGFLLFFVISSMAVAPSVIRRVYKRSYIQSMRHEKVAQQEQLRRHVEQMSALEESLDVQRVRVEKLIAVYGLDRAGLGNGGLPNPLALGRNDPSPELQDARSQETQLRNSVMRLQQQIEILSRYERENAELIRHVPSILPIPSDQFVLTSPFGGRISPFTRTADFHKGLDLAAPTGTPVLASGDGVVTFAGRYPMSQNVGWWRFGNVVVINHADRFITIYAHCDTVNVQQGQRVSQGDLVATVGSTGWSTNSHLHYEVRSDLERPGQFDPVDPRIYILDYQWSDEEALLIRSRTSKDYRNFDPLPVAFIGKRGV